MKQNTCTYALKFIQTYTAEYWIKKLQLKPHPEGGYYKRTYCSEIQVSSSKTRYTASMIYYLLNQSAVSHFHRLKSDEIWLHQYGSAVAIFIIAPNGTLIKKRLGNNPEKDENLQVFIPANHWFAACNTNKKSFSLVSCMVTPSFNFNDFEIAQQSQLLAAFPEHEKIITSFSK